MKTIVALFFICVCYIGGVEMFALNCPLGIVNCFVDPCEIAQQNGCYGHPNAVCQSDYCGGCHARWYENGHIVICGTQSIG